MPDLDLEVKGAPVIQTLRKEGGGGGTVSKIIFSALAFGPQFGLKIRGEGGGLPGPSPGSAIGFRCSDVLLVCEFFLSSFVTVMRQG